MYSSLYRSDICLYTLMVMIMQGNYGTIKHILLNSMGRTINGTIKYSLLRSMEGTIKLCQTKRGFL
jgi:hypothetical protein